MRADHGGDHIGVPQQILHGTDARHRHRRDQAGRLPGKASIKDPSRVKATGARPVNRSSTKVLRRIGVDLPEGDRNTSGPRLLVFRQTLRNFVKPGLSFKSWKLSQRAIRASFVVPPPAWWTDTTAKWPATPAQWPTRPARWPHMPAALTVLNQRKWTHRLGTVASFIQRMQCGG